MRSNQHAVSPRPAPGIERAWSIPGLAVEAQLLVRFDPQCTARMRRWHQRNPPLEHGDFSTVAKLAHIQARRLGLQGAVGGTHQQRARVPGGSQQHFAFEQADHPLLFIKLHIDRAGGVEPDLAAVLQLHVAPLPHRAAEVCQQRGHGQLLAQAPGQRRASA